MGMQQHSIAPHRARGFHLLFVLAVCLGLWLGASALVVAAAPGPFDDVPPRTWSYAIVDHFIDEGWVDGYPAGMYVAGRALSRYEMGLITTNLIDRLGRGEHSALTMQEMSWLRMLVREYGQELALLGYYQEPVLDEPPQEATQEEASVRSPEVSAAPPMPDFAYRLRPPDVVVVSGASALSPSLLSHTFEQRPGQHAQRLQHGLDGLADQERESTSPLARAVDDRLSWASLAAPEEEQHSRPRLVSLGLSSAYTGPGPFLAVDGSQGWPGSELNGLGLEVGEQASQEGFLLSQVGFSTLNGDSPQYVRLGSRTRVGLLKRPYNVWTSDPLASPPRSPLSDEWDVQQYELVLELGDVRITTGQATVYGAPRTRLDEEGGRVEASGASSFPRHPTPIPGLEPSWEDEFMYLSTTSRAGVDMDVHIPQAKLRLGWGYEGEFDSSLSPLTTLTRAGMEYQFDSRAQALAEIALEDKDEGTTRTTQLGLRYNLSRDSSLLLGYRLIDFTELHEDEKEEIRTKLATAEFSIRF